MTRLKELRKKTTIILPKSGAEVEIWDGFSALDVEKINRHSNKYGEVSLIQMTVFLIVKWDFTDEQENPVAISTEAVEKLHMEDLYFILKESKIDTDFLGEGEQGDSPTGSK